MAHRPRDIRGAVPVQRCAKSGLRDPAKPGAAPLRHPRVTQASSSQPQRGGPLMATTNTIDIMSEDFVRDPYAHYKLLRDSAPVYYDARLDVYLISKYADVRASLRDRRFTTAPLATRAEPVMQGVVLAQMEGADHAAKHGIVVRGIASP